MLVPDASIGRWPLSNNVDCHVSTSERFLENACIFLPSCGKKNFTLTKTLTLNWISASSCSFVLWFSVIVGVELLQRFLLRGCVVDVGGSLAWLRRCLVVVVKVLLSSINDAMERSSSSYTSEAWSRLLCLCNVEAPLVTSWTEENPGMRFYRCGLYKVRKNNFVGVVL